MKKETSLSVTVAIMVSTFMVSGCAVRTYNQTQNRVDQELSTGNRGYIMGGAPRDSEQKPRKTTRTTRVLEIEMGSPRKQETTKTETIKNEEAAAYEPSVQEETSPTTTPIIQEEVKKTEIPALSNESSALQKYTVQKGDTLQKISQKFFGTTKKWVKIFEINKAELKSPNKIYPGMVINIPIEAAANTQENLK